MCKLDLFTMWEKAREEGREEGRASRHTCIPPPEGRKRRRKREAEFLAYLRVR